MTTNIEPDLSALTVLALEPGDLAAAELAEAAVICQDATAALRLLERTFTDALGKTAGKHAGNVSDGRQYEVRRAQDRKEWLHDDWKHDVRRKVVEGLPPSLVLVDADTGEGFHRSLEYVVSEALIAAQEVHGAGAPRSRDLKSLGLYASDYCTSSPAGWRLTTVRTDGDAAAPSAASTAASPAVDAKPSTAAASLPSQREAS